MSRTLSAGMSSHIAGVAHKRCNMLRLDLVDGSVLAITDHDADLTFDLGDGAVTYLSGTGIFPSDLSLGIGFEASDIEITGPIDPQVTRAAVLGGRYDDAVARFFQVNWGDLTQGPVRLLKGRVSVSTVEGGRFKFVIQSEGYRFTQQVGRVITGYCDADFGDARCGYVVTPLAATVATVTNDRQFTVTFTGSYANDYFNRGTVIFTSGDLAGTRPVEVHDWTSAGGVVLWTSLVAMPEVGDTLEIRQGCGKTRADCMAFGNVVNFRGFPDVPGTDQILKYPVP